jgi:hypothetical protein
MKTQANKAWTAEQLVNFSDALGNGYAPGVNGADVSKADHWTAQRHIQASMMRAQAYL